MYRKLTFLVLAIFVMVGIGLAFDHRFVPIAMLTNSPLFVVLVYFPTLFFAVFAFVKLRRGRIWPLAAFATGLIGTGIFHQIVLEDSYGNPGYMIPAGHIAAPIVSLAAYVVSFLGAWAISRLVETRATTTSGR